MSKRYVNPYQKRVFRGAIHFILWQFGYYGEHIPEKVPDNFAFPNQEEEIEEKKPQITWINHSTFWISAYGKNILTDPIWNLRCSPFKNLGPKRFHPPLPPIGQMPKIDMIIISHNHYDHLDLQTIKMFYKINPNIQWILPRGVKKWFCSAFPETRKEQIKEMDWWETANISGLQLTAVPAQHFSGRGLFDRNKSLWMGCVCKFSEGKQFYFAGDTGYNSFHFKEIGKKFCKMDLSLIPIGAYSPRGFMKAVHVNPQEAVLIHKEVGSKLSIGGHWKTFRLSSEALERPPYDLYCALQNSKISCSEFRVLNPGQTINW